MNRTRAGFTLMEIMVVIIVIAVLASVAGPMIGSITDQGRTSATKSKMSALKSAMLAYQSDVGRLPFAGKPGCAGCIAAYCAVNVLCDSITKNVLLNEVYGNISDAANFGISNYSKKWKGPYMDSDPTDFMYDSWGNPFRYIAYKNNVYLWSSGPNSGFEPDGVTGCIECAICATMVANGDVDDIVLSIAKVRRPFN